MGLLDDAIREHLELKRRHGADPEEVSRQESEALGAPVRGEFALPAAATSAAESEVDEELRAEAPAAEDELEPSDEQEDEALAAPGPGAEEDPWLVEDLADEPPPAEPPPGEPPPAGEPPAEDVLEETPEFLQETPEHERLWFEQKPPRGFDWDK